jgi:hypothetical protein
LGTGGDERGILTVRGREEKRGKDEIIIGGARSGTAKAPELASGASIIMKAKTANRDADRDYNDKWKLNSKPSNIYSG